MTREKRTRYVVFNCDGCSEFITEDTDDFHDTLDALKKAKWIVTKEKDEWVHYCPACHEKQEEKDDRKVPDRDTKRTKQGRQNYNRR
jgi:cytochrome c553